MRTAFIIAVWIILSGPVFAADPLRAVRPDPLRAVKAQKVVATCPCGCGCVDCSPTSPCGCGCPCGEATLETYNGVRYEFRAGKWTGKAIDAAGRVWQDGKLISAPRLQAVASGGGGC